VEEGIAFCPHCGAPQIRVSFPEATSQPGPELPTGQVIAPPPGNAGGGWQQPTYPTHQSAPIHWDLALKGALLTGIGAGLLSAVPIVSLGCCLWILGAGALSAFLYQKRTPLTAVTPGMGMRIGALTGVFGFLVNAVVTTLTFVVFRSNNDFRQTMQEQMNKQMAASPDPRAQQMMQQFMDWMNTPAGLATFLVIILVVLAVVFVLFSAAGGALGISMFGRRPEQR